MDRVLAAGTIVAARYMLSARPVLAADRPIAPLPGNCPIAIEQIPCLHPRDGEPLTAARLAETVRAVLDNELLAERASGLGRELAALEPADAHLDSLIDGGRCR